ncbi:CotH kinase family protein [Dyadobacter sp. CY312]|uniref:CotH kinase family protein n=1 Tax=Dyadobacter sp. CY312 TaxID=2907303 RepID=UPI001F327854|nr:CotH kinase family protein [Dyadobacter sp. CY312]MCE7039437.1 CotH kinase family protein [Dyadobacter sp. CY312]
MKKLSFLLFALALPLFLQAQIAIDPSRYFVDESRKMIVCNEPLSTFQNPTIPIKLSVNGKIYTLPNTVTTLNYGSKYTAIYNSITYDLYFTDLPLLNLTVENITAINGEVEIPGTMSLADNANQLFQSPMAIRTRGNSSSFFPKKSYRVQLKDDAGKNKDHSLLGLRSDKRWLLLAQWNEEIRANNAVSHNLWINMHKLYYSNTEPNAISSIRSKYVEVFLNNSYLGIYLFTEDMDRKQLQLKKEDNGLTKGELYKADDWSLSASFAGIGVPKAAPGSESWQSWELDYPDYSTWQNHYDFLTDVIQSNDSDFKNLIWNRLKIENVIDYYIFMNLMQAEDNLEKNYFLGRYDQGEPYFFIPWDLDATWGYNPDGSRSNKYQDIKTNELFKRLIRLNPGDFNNKLATRWFDLRQSLLSENNLKNNFTSNFNTLNATLAYERENRVASDQYNSPDRTSGLTYLHNYINKRLPWLDNYFCPMLTSGTCLPNTSTCNFAIAPTSDKQNYSPASQAILQANCTGNDCSATSFTWSGNGLNVSGTSTSFTLPTSPGEYTYTLTATKNGCSNKTADVKITVEGNTTANCDFTVAANATPASPGCSAPVNLSATCNGADCSGVTYKWTGNGINLSGSSVNTNAPSTNGTFTYTVTASKAGCPDKTATTNVTVTTCNTNPSEPFSVCLEAELANGNGSISSDPNASADRTRGDQNGSNQYVDYAVNGVPAAGVYQIKLRYAANSKPTISISVNGVSQNSGIQILATHSWNIVFREETIPVTLSAGNNVVRIQSLTGPSCRQDKICISGNTDTPSTCNFAIAPTSDKQNYSPASQAVLQANCTGSDCSATSFTWSGNGLNASGTSTSFTLPTSPGEYTYTLTATKNGCSNKTANVKITVEGNTTANCDFTVAGNATPASPGCSAPVNLSATCNGADCSGVTYKWTGNGINLSGSSVNTNAPSTNGTFTYTVTASKAGCPDKTATTNVTVTTCNTNPSEPFSVCLEAELANGNGSISSDPNASADRTRGDQNGSNQYVDYAVNDVPAAGVYQIKLRYAANSKPTIGISVNGTTQNSGIQIPATHSWNIVFREETIPVTLTAGNNVVRIQSLTGPSCRQDKICVSGNTDTPSTCNFAIAPTSDKQNYSPASQAVLQANCTGSDCSATSFTWSGNGLNASGTSTSFTLPTNPGEYTYTLTATKNGCSNKTANVKITVEGNTTANCDFTVAANATPASAGCSAPVNLSANCNGADCSGVTYKWTGSGINLSGSSVNTNAPSTNGTFTYTVTASKAGCPDKIATTNVTVTTCNTPSQPFSVCLEAELANGNGSISSDPNASAGSTRGDQNGNNQYVDYAVNDVPTAGVYQIKLRYAANEKPTISISVNGTSQNSGIQIPATHSWNIVFREETIPVTLTTGNNVVRIQSLTGPSCRQDKICVSGNTPNARIASGYAPQESVEVEGEIESLTVSPNPTSTEFTVKFLTTQDTESNLTVTDILGNLLHQQTVKKNGYQYEKIRIPDTAQGVLLIQLQTGNKLETKRLVIVR